MIFLKNKWHQYKLYFLLFLGFILIILLIFVFRKNNSKENELEFSNEPILTEAEVKEETTASFYVEIKGAINNPGVYLVQEGQIINDLITLAGGYKDNAYTDNINLSYALKKEMVIYIYTTKEYQDKTKPKSSEVVIPKCDCESYLLDNCPSGGTSIMETTEPKEDNSKSEDNSSFEITVEQKVEDTENSLINLNTATKDELMTLKGIGEAKAQKIIEYRNQNGPFKNIKDIKNVSGIGDAMYEKIKAYITV